MRTADKDIPAILVALIIAVIPYWTRLPLWISVWCLFCWGYALQAAWRSRPLPKAWLRQLLIPIGLLGVLGSNDWTLAEDTFVGMLAIMISLKPLEIKTHRDKMITGFLSYFLILTHLLYDNSFFIALHMLASVCLTTAVLIHINHAGAGMREHLKLSVRIMLQAFPLTIVLFILFPRMQGQLWGVFNPSAERTGFSERLSPGDISNLALNHAIAFRVDFQGNMPPPNQLYWRGIVFWYFTGQSWERGNRAPTRRVPFPGTETVEYTVSLEPHYRQWWFALDLPEFAPRQVSLLDDFTLASWRRVTERTVYTLRSHRAYHTGPLRFWEAAALELPPQGNPKARALAQEWSDQNREPEALVAAALSFLKENEFTYTLRPTPLEGDRIDDFLFRTRNGYCEHFASAFAYLMRAAQIPARIVGGYLGGERNPFGNYLIVRQSDAHAWVEVWLPKTGWTRIDPTSAIAPARIEQGSAAALPPAERPIYLSSRYMAWLYRYWKPVQFAWDRVNTGWNLGVIGYSRSWQQELLTTGEIMGEPVKRILIGILFLSASIAVGLGVFYWSLRKSGLIQTEMVQKSYELFCQKLARTTRPRRPEQGPVDYARQVAGERADLAESIEEITALYVRLRYGHGGDVQDEKQLQKMAKDFKPRKK
jgi:transglutaminase-like putative cysteine protease